MEFFAGNIDTNNIRLLAEASKTSNVEFRQGSYMSFSINHKKHHDFHPIFCETRDKAIHLLKSYLEISKKQDSTHNFDNDSYMVSESEINNAS